MITTLNKHFIRISVYLLVCAVMETASQLGTAYTPADKHSGVLEWEKYDLWDQVWFSVSGFQFTLIPKNQEKSFILSLISPLSSCTEQKTILDLSSFHIRNHFCWLKTEIWNCSQHRLTNTGKHSLHWRLFTSAEATLVGFMFPACFESNIWQQLCSDFGPCNHLRTLWCASFSGHNFLLLMLNSACYKAEVTFNCLINVINLAASPVPRSTSSRTLLAH